MIEQDVLQLVSTAVQKQIASGTVQTGNGTKLVSLTSRGSSLIVAARCAGGVSQQFIVSCAALDAEPTAATEGSPDESATTAADASEPAPADAGMKITEAAEPEKECCGACPESATPPSDTESAEPASEPQTAPEAEGTLPPAT
jgi:hypothetical protein